MTTMTDEVIAPPSTSDCVLTMCAVRDEMRGILVERDVEIELLILSVIARTHLLLIGTGGVAKSMVSDELHKRITGCVKFYVQLAKSMPVEEVVGPVSLVGLQNDTFRHVTTDTIVEANLAILDEVFKANSVVLNRMLGILNERTFKNAGARIDVPLWSAIGASNELPTEPELAPFRDRWAATRLVSPVKTDDGFMEILRGQVARNNGSQATLIPTTIPSSQIIALQEAARQITVPTEVYNDLAKMRRTAEAEANLFISARRYGEGLKLCQAQALLAGRDAVTSEDLALFQHVLWSDEEDIPKALEATIDFAGQVARAASKLRVAFEPFRNEVDQIDLQTKSAQISAKDGIGRLSDVMVNLKIVRDKTDAAVTEAQASGHDATELVTLQGEITASLRAIRDSLMG